MVVVVISQGASLVTALVGAVMLRLSVTSAYLSYVKPGMRIPLILSGLVLLGLGIPGIYRATKGSHTPRMAYALMAPVIALLVVAPGPLGGYAADRQTTKPPPASAAGASSTSGKLTLPAIPAGDPAIMPVVEFAVRATYDEGRSLAGRTAKITGFVTTDAKGWYVARMSLQCCAADASAAKVRIVGAPAPKKGAWVTVTGTWVDPGGAFPRKELPGMAAMSVTPIAPPENPYE